MSSYVTKRIRHTGTPYCDLGSFNDLVLSASLHHDCINGSNRIICHYDCSAIVQNCAISDMSVVKQSTNLAWLQCMVKAVHYLHSQGYVHGDIKPENFLIYDQQLCKLTDFGTTCIYGHQQPLGTPEYWAPELSGARAAAALWAPELSGAPVSTVPTMTFATDLYALGVTIDVLFDDSVKTPSMHLLTHHDPLKRPTTAQLMVEMGVVPGVVVPLWQPPQLCDIMSVQQWVPHIPASHPEVTQIACRLLKHYVRVTQNTNFDPGMMVAFSRLASRLLTMHGYNVAMVPLLPGVFLRELAIINALSGVLLLPAI